MFNLLDIKAQHKLNNLSEKIAIPDLFLKQFPDIKAEKAQKIFDKYVKVVSQTLIKRLPFLNSGRTFVSTHALVEECGTFDYKKTRYRIWSVFKEIYPFVEILSVGSNLKKTHNHFEKNSEVRILEKPMTMLLEDMSPHSIFQNFFAGMTEEELELAEYLDIDMENLSRYIGNTEQELLIATDTKHREKLQGSLWQAKIIHSIGLYTMESSGSAFLPQIPKKSIFGRVYYKGMSIQNVSKQVRSAILGHHYQYDMDAAVFAIKLYLYSNIMGGTNELVGTKLGSYTREYIREKNQIRSRLARECFKNVDLKWELKIKAIKNALTAIGFGAKTTGKSWLTSDGFKGTALTEILLSPEVRRTFLQDEWVKAFLNEQTVMEDTILDHVRNDPNYVTISEDLKNHNTTNGKVTRSLELAYMYQQWETKIMDLAVAAVESNGIKVVARIHDAFIVKTKLPIKVTDDIKVAWGLIDFLSLDCEEVREWADPAFKKALREAEANEAQHKKVMLQAEQEAVMYNYTKLTHSGGQ